MEISFLESLFSVSLVALFGGLFVRFLKLPLTAGFIFAGIVAGVMLPNEIDKIQGLSEIGLVLLLFSVGLEMSLSRLTSTGSVALIGAILQMFSVGVLLYVIMVLVGISSREALILSFGFSLSSTALIVKILEERAETESIHGEIMIGWLLVQDLAVIPIVALMSVLGDGSGLVIVAGKSLVLSGIVVLGTYFLGRRVAPYIIHLVASFDSRELLILAAISLAMGTAEVVGLFGISSAIGAFLAGVVISESQENHAIFAETRPLRDLFVIIFFVTLGFFVSPSIFIKHIFLILGLVVAVIISKIILIFLIMLILNYRGKTLFSVSMGLSQIGEFSFVIFLGAKSLNLLSSEMTMVGISITLVTLILTPFLFKLITPTWRWFKKLTKLSPKVGKILFAGTHNYEPREFNFTNHVVICGFGRMGRWVGYALELARIPFVVIDYNQAVVRKARSKGVSVIYGDPVEGEILEAADIRRARALVVAIPDMVIQEEVISYCQNVAPKLPIFARAHLDRDASKLIQLKIRKVIQPEFEGALSIIKEIFRSLGKDKEEISKSLKDLRRVHTMKL